VHEVIEELEEKSKDLGAVIEFFEPPAVPGYGAAGGFSLRLLDKTNGTDYHEFDRINKEFMDALGKRKELTGLFTFYAANYPQYELVIDNEAGHAEGRVIGKAMENLDILIGSTYEQGFIRFGRFFKVYTQAAPEYRRYPVGHPEPVREERPRRDGPVLGVHDDEEAQGPNEITRYNLYNSAAIRGEPAPGYTSGDAIAAVQEVAATTLPRGYDIAWEGLSYDEARRGNEAIYIFLVVLASCTSCSPRSTRASSCRWRSSCRCPARVFGSFLLLKRDGPGQRHLRPGRPHHARRPARQERGAHRRVRGAEAARGA
jgi:HAE1 family hydrophobic/amphiphilic exporter-1